MSITTPDWVRDAIFYQIFPDRFASSKRVPKNGLILEPWESPPSAYGFKGGDLIGISEHLDYLQDLGINAIYLNPITASASNHRYHTYDYFKIDPLLGGDLALRELLDAAHARNIRIILDGVFNHASRGIWQFHHVLENGSGSPYVDWFHFNPDFLDGKRSWGAYPSYDQLSQLKDGSPSYETLGYRAWWNLPALPKLNTSTPAVREFIYAAATHWIRYGIDGWRLDVPAEIDDDGFWQEFRHSVKRINPDAYIVGEIWHESQRWLQGDQFDAVMNYLLTGALMGWLIGNRLPPYIFNIGDYHKYLKAMTAIEFADRIDYLLNLYDPAINSVQLNLLDSHDTPRFITTAGDDATALQLGWLFLFTFVGTPCIYYGDETGMSGGPDPACRGAFCWNEKEWNLGLSGYAKSLTTLRTAHLALRRGSYTRLFADNALFAFSRAAENEILVIAINAGADTMHATLPAPPNLPAGPLACYFGKANANVLNGEITDLVLPPRSGVVIGKSLH